MCIFCSIVNKKIPANIVKEDEEFIAFKDINPKAKTHLLVIPKVHSENFQMTEPETIAKVSSFIQALAKEKNIENNYKIQINNGEKAGQEVMHLHFHILSNEAI
ncbi:MAG: Histidine triad (HIT) family protein [uncultured Campylobacterales bacterium]|uniref:Histidine triad (HIT) family protein n=1 Tax=uncultured Campylobacterales bacterium TaxID=352960 RepID=A0A6S6SKP2_9BACT|nr:MAG: Histidine triad (HIT) family protein [uncultured Campylobacterales bacterium]